MWSGATWSEAPWATEPPRIRVVQRQTASNNTLVASADLTWSTAPTTGRFLIVVLYTRSPDVTTPSGWTRDLEIINGAPQNDRLIWFSKVATGSDNFSAAQSVNDTYVLEGIEIDGLTSPVADVSASTSPADSLTSVSSGTTGTTTVKDVYAIAGLATRSPVTAESATNGFALRASLADAGWGDFLTADQILGSAGTVETTFAWTTSVRAWAGVVVYRSSTAAAPQILTATAPTVTTTAPAATRTTTVTRTAGACLATITAPAATRAASITRTATAPSAIVTAPAAGRAATRTAGAGAPSAVVTAPAATLVELGGPLVANAALATVTAPAAARLASITRTAGAPSGAFSAPSATLAAGATVLQASAPVARITAPGAFIPQDAPEQSPRPMQSRWRYSLSGRWL